jgi:hypothetical protein
MRYKLAASGHLFGSQQVDRKDNHYKTFVLSIKHLPKLHLTHKSLTCFREVGSSKDFSNPVTKIFTSLHTDRKHHFLRQIASEKPQKQKQFKTNSWLLNR